MNAIDSIDTIGYYYCDICNQKTRKKWRFSFGERYLCGSSCKETLRIAYEFAASARNRAIRYSALHTLTFDQWLATLEWFDYTCAYCEKPYSCMDYVLPLKKGGASEFKNAVPSCENCRWPDSRAGNRLFEGQALDRIRFFQDKAGIPSCERRSHVLSF